MRPNEVKVCKSKLKILTEKSAIRVSKALSVEYGKDFTYYKCGQSKHFHLTHKNPSERIGHGNKFQPTPTKESKER